MSLPNSNTTRDAELNYNQLRVNRASSNAEAWVFDRLRSIILNFWHRYDEDGVERTVSFDESERVRVSNELADYIKKEVHW